MTRAELIQELIEQGHQFGSRELFLRNIVIPFFESREQELRDKLLSDKFTYCAYCGQEFNIGGEEAKAEVGKHIHDCEKHPISEYKAKIAELQEREKLLLEKIGKPLMEVKNKGNGEADYEDWAQCIHAINEALAIIEKEQNNK